VKFAPASYLGGEEADGVLDVVAWVGGEGLEEPVAVGDAGFVGFLARSAELGHDLVEL
jgi:hypothetical protein